MFVTSHFRTELCLFVARLSRNARVSHLNIVPKLLSSQAFMRATKSNCATTAVTIYMLLFLLLFCRVLFQLYKAKRRTLKQKGVIGSLAIHSGMFDMDLYANELVSVQKNELVNYDKFDPSTISSKTVYRPRPQILSWDVCCFSHATQREAQHCLERRGDGKMFLSKYCWKSTKAQKGKGVPTVVIADCSKMLAGPRF